NGCPFLDTDKDTIPDKDDKCPYEPGPKETEGCPPPHKYINVTQEQIELLEQSLFAADHLPADPGPSIELLEEVVSVLKSRPTMRLHIESHENTLDPDRMKLTKRRAETILNFLVKKGVAPERLTSEGYGTTRPLCTKKTKACQARNRRIEFIIVQQ